MRQDNNGVLREIVHFRRRGGYRGSGECGESHAGNGLVKLEDRGDGLTRSTWLCEKRRCTDVSALSGDL